MKCPYCEKEMACGYLYDDNQPLQWIPKGKHPPRLSYSTAEDAIKLNNTFSFFKTGGYSAEAFFCDACRVVLARTEEKV